MNGARFLNFTILFVLYASLSSAAMFATDIVTLTSMDASL